MPSEIPAPDRRPLEGPLGVLARHLPFAQMEASHLQRLVTAASLRRCHADEVVASPDDGPVTELVCLLSGSVTGRRAAQGDTPFRYEAGDVFPVGALMAGRPVTATYRADVESEVLLVPAEVVHALAVDSPPFADFMNRRALQFLEFSRRALQAEQAAQALARQSLESPLRHLMHERPLSCRDDTTLREALLAMQDRRVGSILVLDAQEAPSGILTRHDILERITLPQRSLDTPIGAVMSAPVVSLGTTDTAHDAALAMSRHGVRHIPVVDAGRVVGIVSERDLFALQRRSLSQVSASIRAAADRSQLQGAARELRRFARHLLAQGVQARQVTELISHLNDVLTERVVQLQAARAGLDLGLACWLAFGSEGRGEQTIATDQDNGLVFASDAPERDRPAWLALGRAVNEELAACGYPLCKGGVMAGEPACCLTPAEWQARFEGWIDRGAPADLLHASIYFDMRVVAGAASLFEPQRQALLRRAGATPRFLKQLADNAQRQRVGLNWLGAVETRSIDGHDAFDLKLGGTAVFVDAARLLALGAQVDAPATRLRLAGAAAALHVPAQESEAWQSAFEFLQMLRLRVQLELEDGTSTRARLAVDAGQPNLVAVEALNDIDRRMLREALRVARRLQQRLELDYQR